MASNNYFERIILLIDMDCFYCQVEEKLRPDLKGKPMAVVQYNGWIGGGIIAVNYAARDQGVTRFMRGDEAKTHCPEISIVTVPVQREKADLTKYRTAGMEVALVLQDFSPKLERASIDEAYMDITDVVDERMESVLAQNGFDFTNVVLENCYAAGFTNINAFVNEISARLEANPHDKAVMNDLRLLMGSIVANDIRAAVKAKTGYECSAGIAHNKIMAKLGCGINKPNKQTIISSTHISELLDKLPIKKITGLGGQLGERVCELLNVQFVGQITQFSESELQKKFNAKIGTWLYQTCRGINLEPVTPRFYAKSIGCCKNFPGLNSITVLSDLAYRVQLLCQELFERLEKDRIENHRRPTKLNVNFSQEINGVDVQLSRSTKLKKPDVLTLSKQMMEVITTKIEISHIDGTDTLKNPIKQLSIAAGKFEANNELSLQQMFAKQAERNKQPTTSTNGVLSNRNENESESEAEPAAAAHSENNDKTISKAADVLIFNEETKKTSFFYNALLSRQSELQSAELKRPASPLKKPAAVVKKPKISSANTSEHSSNLFIRSESAAAEHDLTNQTDYSSSSCSNENLKPPIDALAQQMHLDEMLANKLNKQWNDDKRSSLVANVSKGKKSAKTTTVKNKTAKKKSAKSKNAKSKAVKTQDISKFFTQSSASDTTNAVEATNVDDAPTENSVVLGANIAESSISIAPLGKCCHCNKPIPTTEVADHNDYHIAVKMQAQWNQEILMLRKQSTSKRTNKAAEKNTILKFFK